MIAMSFPRVFLWAFYARCTVEAAFGERQPTGCSPLSPKARLVRGCACVVHVESVGLSMDFLCTGQAGAWRSQGGTSLPTSLRVGIVCVHALQVLIDFADKMPEIVASLVDDAVDDSPVNFLIDMDRYIAKANSFDHVFGRVFR